MMRIALPFVVVTLTVLGACASPPQPIIEDDDDDVGEGEGEGEGEPNGSVTWSAEIPNPSVFPGPDDVDGVLDPVAIDFFLQYDVVLPEPNVPAAQLTIEVCMKRASEAAPACTSDTQPAVAGGGGYRWGFDPSQYDTGLNEYEHTLTLTQQGDVVDEQVLRFEVTAP